MADQNSFSSVQNMASSAQTVSILLPHQPNFDQVAAALALYLSLKKSGKKVAIACSAPMTVEFSSLVGVDQIRTKLPGRNLVISFDYLEDSIEKVSYNIEDNKFNLVVQPKVGFPPLSTKKVKYTYSGTSADLIFTVGVSEPSRLGDLAEALAADQKEPTPSVVNIDANQENSHFSKLNLVDASASSCSEIMAHLISRLSLPVDVDIASNLFAGIQRMTKNFSSSKASATTFEAAAFCLRSGARRHQPSRPDLPKRETLKPMPPVVSAAKKPKEEKKPSPDWFEPKIYKGSTRI